MLDVFGRTLTEGKAEDGAADLKLLRTGEKEEIGRDAIRQVAIRKFELFMAGNASE